MSRVYPSRSAERIIFRERFTNPATVHRNGGVVVGSPEIKNGVTLSGTAQHVTYSGTDLGTEAITIVTEFTPAFEPSDNTINFFYGASSGSDYRLQKHNDANGNNLLAFLGNTQVLIAPLASYEPFWRISHRNRIVVAGVTGSNQMYLNGELLVTSGSNWTPDRPVSFRIGDRIAGGTGYAGVIHSVSGHGVKFDALDVAALEGGSLFSYRNRTAVWFDMAESTRIASQDRTLDKGSTGAVLLLGDGAGVGKPSFRAPGYSFDGVDDYFTLPADPTGTFTVAWKRRNEAVVFESDLTTWNLIKAAGSFAGLLDYLAWWPFALSPLQKSDLSAELGGGV